MDIIIQNDCPLVGENIFVCRDASLLISQNFKEKKGVLLDGYSNGRFVACSNGLPSGSGMEHTYVKVQMKHPNKAKTCTVVLGRGIRKQEVYWFGCVITFPGSVTNCSDSSSW